MALTWKNVDAPNMVGVGNLLESSMTGLRNSFQGVRDAQDRRTAQRVAGYSGDALTRMAAIEDGDTLRDYISQLDGRMLSPEAQRAINLQGDVLLDRERLGVGIEGQRATIDNLATDRAAEGNAAAVRLRMEQLLASGDTQAAYDLAASQGGRDAAALMEWAVRAGSTTKARTDITGAEQAELRLRENQDTYDRNTAQYADYDTVTEFLGALRNPTEGAWSPEEADNLIRQAEAEGRLTASQAAMARVRARDEEGPYQFDDPNLDNFTNRQGVVLYGRDGDRPISGVMQDIEVGNDAITKQIELIREKDPYSRLTKAASTISGETEQQIAQSMIENFGVKTGWTKWEDTKQDAHNLRDAIKAAAKAKGITVDVDSVEGMRRVYAAMAQTAQVSGRAWSDNLVNNKADALKLFMDAHSSSGINMSASESKAYERAERKISEFAERLAHAENIERQAVSRGDTVKAAQARESVYRLLTEQENFITEFNDEYGEDPSAAARPGQDAAAKVRADQQAADNSKTKAELEAEAREISQIMSAYVPSATDTESIAEQQERYQRMEEIRKRLKELK